MNLIDLDGTEQNPVYKRLERENNLRYYGFLDSMTTAALDSGQHQLSHDLIKAINFHAIVGLHLEAGQYRSRAVHVGDFDPPHHSRVETLMNDFIQWVNQNWDATPSIELAAYALWRITHIHPFINGNGRTARAVCYFILCLRAGGILPGRETLPEVLGRQPIRAQYVQALKTADAGILSPLANLIGHQLLEQVEDFL